MKTTGFHMKITSFHENHPISTKDPLPGMVTSMFQFLPQLNNVSGNHTRDLFQTWYFRLYHKTTQ